LPLAVARGAGPGGSGSTAEPGDAATGEAGRDARPVVLLVEDNAPNVLVAQAYLDTLGFRSDVAENGPEAIEMRQASSYVAVLMDVQMPGMNGFEVTQLIREYERREGVPAVPVIGVTAHALAGDRERCLAAGMDDYISKPVLPDILALKLGQIR
ncbi:MAG: response regulator, partial [Asticcacaulis sp.]|nr:response regulator [Asticcacaulis sp.]